MSRRRKKKSLPLPFVLGVIGAAAVCCIIYFAVAGSGPNTKIADQNAFFSIESENSAAIILNGEELEEKGFVADGTIYVPYTTVWSSINSGFYLEGDTLYRTLPEQSYSWSLGDGSGALYKSEDGTVYISESCIAEYSDLDIACYTEPYRLVIRNDWDALQGASVTKDTQIRVKADERSEIATEAVSGESLELLEEGESWSLVLSADGHKGYIQNQNIEKTGLISHEENTSYTFPSLADGQTVKMVWHYIDSVANNQYLDGMLADSPSLNVISPTWFVIDNAQGDLISYADQDYMDKAHNTYGLKVWALINDYSKEDSSTGEILASKENRQRIISQLMESAQTYGFDGINVDFETITSSQAPAYLQFLRELTLEAHARGLVVSTDNYVPTYTKQYKRAEQAKIVDYVVIMGYDEHTSVSEEIGSVASINFVEEGITDTLQEVPASKVILAVPFYTRGWTQTFGEEGFTSEIVNMTDEAEYIDSHGITLSWDESVGQYTGSAEDSDARYTIWVEDAQSIGLKLDLISKYSLGGASAWRIGTETADIWNVWKEKLG